MRISVLSSFALILVVVTLGFASVVQDERTLAELRMELVAAQAERYDAYIALLRATGRSVRVQQRP